MFFAAAVTLQAQTTAFTYQGRLVDSTLPQPTGGSYEMQYKLFDTARVYKSARRRLVDFVTDSQP